MYEFSFDQVHLIGAVLMFILAFSLVWDFRAKWNFGLLSCIGVAIIVAVAWEVVLGLIAISATLILLISLGITIEENTKGDPHDTSKN